MTAQNFGIIEELNVSSTLNWTGGGEGDSM